MIDRLARADAASRYWLASARRICVAAETKIERRARGTRPPD